MFSESKEGNPLRVLVKGISYLGPPPQPVESIRLDIRDVGVEHPESFEAASDSIIRFPL